MIGVSSIGYNQKEIPKPRNHPFNQQLLLAMEAFQERGISIASRDGMISVFEDNNEYAKYKDIMFGDIANEEARVTLGDLLDKDRGLINLGEDIAAEDGSVGNVTMFSYLNGPVLRAIWARCIVQALMRVVALKQTNYTMTFDIPYYYDGSTKKILPYALVDTENTNLISLDRLIPKASSGSDYIVADGVITFVDRTAVGNIIELSLENPDPVISRHDGRHVDRRMFIKNLKYKDINGAIVTSQMTLQPSSYGNSQAGDFIFTFEVPTETSPDPFEPASFMCIVNIATGRFRAATTSDDIISFEPEMYLSPEDNRTARELSTEQASIEVMIGAGQHVMINTPVELLQEYPTSHQGADYVVTMTDIASEFYAGDMNLEMINFYKRDLQLPAAARFIPEDVLRGMNIDNAEFDIRVAHGENPSAYIDQMLKKCISFYVNKIRSYSRIEEGYWCMVGHALNMMHIPDFKYEGFAQLNGDGDTKKEDVYGFKVGYTFGFTSNIINGPIRCLFTPEISQPTGILSFFTSVDDKRPTAIFHPFSYTVSRGYQNPRNQLIPSIMITKRHTFQSFIPMNFKLTLNGNNGAQFTTPKTPITPNT